MQPKTAFVLIHKLGEAMAAETRDATLDGEVEVDGAEFGGHVRPANLRDERVDRRLFANRRAGASSSRCASAAAAR